MIILQAVLLIVLFLMFQPIGIVIYVEGNNVIIHIIIFRVIKIRLNDKTKDKMHKYKSRFKKKFNVKIAYEFFQNMRPHLNEVLSKTDLSIDLGMEFGLSYPHRTAIMYGVLNSLIYSLENILRANFHRYRGEYKITPDMNKCFLNYRVKIKMIISSIFALIKLMKVLLKYMKYFNYKEEGGAVNVRTRNRRTHENYNG